MSLVVVFEVRGELAHFRRPDTLGTHATYPFPTRTVLHGLIASVLGATTWPEGGRVGLRLLRPVRTVAQQLSLHGKTWEAGSGRAESFHRPTSIELVVQPHYRIYTVGPHADEFAGMLRARRSHFHTYLGSAFCLTFPYWVSAHESVPLNVTGRVECVSVIPAPAVERLTLEDGRTCARVGGVLLEHLGPFADRRFRGSTAVLYEPNGGSLAFDPTPRDQGAFWEFHNLPGEGMVCLW
jgi:CRISPR-associated protein Cas5h